MTLVKIAEIILHCVLQVTLSDQSVDIVDSNLTNCRFTKYHTVGCGVSEDLKGFYREGDALASLSLSSITSSLDVFESSTYFGRTDTGTMFSIETRNGKLIRVFRMMTKSFTYVHSVAGQIRDE